MKRAKNGSGHNNISRSQVVHLHNLQEPLPHERKFYKVLLYGDLFNCWKFQQDMLIYMEVSKKKWECRNNIYSLYIIFVIIDY